MKNIIRKIKVIMIGILMIISSTMVLNPSIVEADTSNGLSKTVTRVEGKLNEWEINLSVEVEPVVQKQDIIVVIDRSGSMDENSRMANAKTAAKLFVNTILDPNKIHDTRIALISYSSDVQINNGFTNNVNTLIGNINGLSADGGTFSQGALYEARNLMTTARSGAEKIIVFLSDGAPSFGYNLNSAGKLTAKTKARTSSGISSPNYRLLTTNTPGGYTGANSIDGNTFYIDGGWEEGIPTGNFDYTRSTAGGNGGAAYHLMQEIEKTTGSNPKNQYLLLNLYKTLVSEAQYAKDGGSRIYSIALDLGGDAKAGQSLQKVATSPADYFVAASGNLEEKFKNIAQSIQMPLENMQVYDQMGTGFSLVAGSAHVTSGSQTGLSTTESDLTWDLAPDSFTYDNTAKVYRANVIYRIRTNTDAIPLIEDTTNYPSGYLPTNESAVFTYTDNGTAGSKTFPVPEAKPTILAVVKDKYEYGNDPDDLTDETNQRQYKYNVSNGNDVLEGDHIDNSRLKTYHILQETTELTMNEYTIVNDDINRFAVTYRMFNHAGESVMVNGKFTLVPETGMNTVHIENNLKSTYGYDGFGITKNVVDHNDNSYAELDEILTYTITIDNLEDVFIRNVHIQDTLNLVEDYLESFGSNELIVEREGVVEAMGLTVADLVAGFDMMIGGLETITLTFDVKVKASAELPDFLNNTVTVNEKSANAEIETAIPQYTATKSVVDGNGNQLAEAGEDLTYTIHISNTGKIRLENILVKDELENIIDHIQDPTLVVVTIGSDTYTLAQLATGIPISLDAGMSEDVIFTVTLLQDFNAKLIGKLKNIAAVNELRPEAEIDTGYFDLAASKSVSDANNNQKAEAGEALTYTISVRNIGTTSANGVFIKDDLAGLIDHIKDPASVKVDVGGVEYTLANLQTGFNVDLAANELLEVVFTVVLKDEFDANDHPMIKNIATVGDETPETEIPTGKSIIEATKTVVDANEDGYVEAGEDFMYTITITNSGDVLAKDVILKDDLANIIDYIKNPEDVAVMIGSDNFALSHLATGIKIDLAAGESKEVKFTLTLIDDFDAGEITLLENIASVNDLRPEAEIPTGQSLLEATKTVVDANGDGFAEAGEALTYTITARNNGNIAKNGITIKDGLTELYAHIKSPSAVAVYLDNDGSLETLTLFDLMGGITQNLGAGKSLTLTFTVIVKDDFDAGQIDKLINIAAVHDLEPGTEIPTGRAIIGAEKAVVDENGNGFAEAGEALTYTITVGNAGNVKANNVLIKDELLDFEGIIKNPSAVKVMVGTTEYSLAQLKAGILVDLDAGENLVVEFTIILKDDFDASDNPVLENVATVGPEEPSTEIPTGKAKFIADKTVVDANQDGLAEAGEDLTYTISLKNIGNVKAKDVLIKDDFANLIDHIKDPAAVKVMVGTIEYNLAQLKTGILVDLDVNESLNVVFTVTLKDDFDAAEFTSLYNIATVADKNPDATIDTGKADFEARKTVVDENEDGLAEAGEALTYSLSIKNIGTVKAYDVLIQDELVNLYMHIKEPTLVRVSDGSREYTLTELMNGFEVDLDVNETLTFEFTITLKDDFDASEFLSLYNVATLADKNPDAEIATGRAILESEKNVSDANEDGFAEAGEALTYRIFVRNTGNVTARDILIKDDLADIHEHIQDPDAVEVWIGEYKHNLEELKTGILVDVEAEGFVEISFRVLLKKDFDADENPVLKNIATVGDDEPEIEIPTGKAIIAAQKDVVDASEDGFVEAGENFTYTITVRNTGNVKAKDVLIKDNLADIKTFIKDPDAVLVMVGLDDYTLDDLEAGITIDLDAGATARVKFTLTLRDEFEAREITNLENIAHVNELTPEAEIPTGYSYLEANKTVKDANGDGFAEAGEALTYTIKATNSGNVVKKNILIKDDLANLYAHIDNPASVNVYLDNGGTLETLNLSDLMSGITQDLEAETSMTLVFTVVLKDDFDASKIKELLNIAAVHDLDPEVEIPTGLAILGSDKFVSDENEDGFAEAGEALTYTITVKNTGNVKARDILIKDDLTGIIDHIKNPEDVKVWIRENVYTLEELSSGILVEVNVDELLEVWFTVTLKDDFDANETKALKNIATVGDDKPEVEIPTGKANIEADKKVIDGNKNGYAEAGEALTYTISIKNTGKVKAKDVLIKDDLADMVNHIQDPTALKVMVGETEYTLPELMAGIKVDMDAGENMEVEFTLILKDDFDAKKTLSLKNIAAIGDETPKAEIPTGYYEIKADKRVNDANGDGYAEAGEKLTYTIMVVNDGNVMAKGVKVQDDLANLWEHLKDYKSVVVKVGEQEYSLEDLMNGLEFDLDADEFIELVFTVELKNNFDAKEVKYLMNIAKVNDLRPEAKIDTFAKTKFVLGEKLPDPEKPKEAAPKTILPQTGQSNTLVVSATFLVLIGLGLVLRKREEDE